MIKCRLCNFSIKDSDSDPLDYSDLVSHAMWQHPDYYETLQIKLDADEYVKMLGCREKRYA